MVKHKYFQARLNRLLTDLTHSEVEQYNHNHTAEVDIGHMENRFWSKMVSKKVLNHLWGYDLVYQSGILIRIARGKTVQTFIEEVTR